jgi:hypothetical protein
LTIRPEPAAWGALLSASWQRPGADQRRAFRGELGLPVDRPLVLTGHQPEFWHPGILAKYLAADAAAARYQAAVAWLVVDQAQPAAVAVRYPAMVEGRLTAREMAITADHDATVPDDAATPFVRDGLERIAASMRAARGEPTMTRRVGRALDDLLRPLVSTPARTIYATQLSGTTLFRGLVERIRRDPQACVSAYNAAAARHPGVGVRPLIADEVQDRWELPVWQLAPGGVRRRVFAEMLADAPVEQLAPRALLMTGLVRLAGCDLFIHGTGGGGTDDNHEGYDTVTEEWLRAWLGAEGLAPIAVVSATLLLPLAAEPPPSSAEVQRAVWAAHHARHDPAMTGDAPAAARKRALVDTIRARRDRPARAGLYRTMHAGLEDYRARRGGVLDSLSRRAEDLATRLAGAAILSDRTWPFPLYPQRLLLDLRAAIQRSFGLSPGATGTRARSPA